MQPILAWVTREKGRGGFPVTESEILDRAALAAYIPPVRDALVAAGGRPAVISSIGGKIVALVGEAPRNLVVSEWPSLAAAQAWLSRPNSLRSSRSARGPTA